MLQGRRPAAALEPGLTARLIRESEACAACDRVYFFENGTIFEVGTKPPPTVTQLPGKTVMAGRDQRSRRQSAGHRPAGQLSARSRRRHHRPRGTAATVAWRTSRRTTTCHRARRTRPARTRGDRPKKVETLHIDGSADTVAVFAKNPIRKAGARSETPTVEALRAEFGDGAANTEGAVIITFGSPAAPGPRVAITVSGVENKVNLPARLLTAVRTWLVGPSSVPLTRHLIDLRSICGRSSGLQNTNSLSRRRAES